MAAPIPVLHTRRLTMRPFQEGDREPFAAINTDPEVMEHFLAPLSREESDQFLDRIQSGFADHGFGLWALVSATEGQLLGFTGLSVPGFTAPFMPAVEIGWRLRRSAWGQGLATEAARAALDFGFRSGGLEEVVSFTSSGNVRSLAVMRRLGMTHDPRDDFLHPRVPPGHPLAHHVLFRISRARWMESRS
jgi:ribosomal-protein-alanine N-acetyltransferase